jgi:hypothetical protein
VLAGRLVAGRLLWLVVLLAPEHLLDLRRREAEGAEKAGGAVSERSLGAPSVTSARPVP